MAIVSFKDRRAERIQRGERPKGVPPDLLLRLAVKLRLLDQAAELSDFAASPGTRLEALAGGREGQYSIRINKQWRVCFRWRYGDAYDVEFVDYH